MAHHSNQQQISYLVISLIFFPHIVLYQEWKYIFTLLYCPFNFREFQEANSFINATESFRFSLRHQESSFGYSNPGLSPVHGGTSTPLQGGASSPLHRGASSPLNGGASSPLHRGASSPGCEVHALTSSVREVTSPVRVLSSPARSFRRQDSLAGDFRNPTGHHVETDYSPVHAAFYQTDYSPDSSGHAGLCPTSSGGYKTSRGPEPSLVHGAFYSTLYNPQCSED